VGVEKPRQARHAKLAAALRDMGHRVSASRIPQLLERLGYRRQVNRKSKEGGRHPDRDAQFEHINAQVEAHQAAGQPVISVDTKKKELVGEYKNAGGDYRPQGHPIDVNVHDFIDKELGKAIPYGVCDIGANAGCISVGIDRHTAEFAVNAIRRWLAAMGRARRPTCNRLMIAADGGGSNGSRVRLWKIELQKLADQTGLTIGVRHYPPGASKWNKIEHLKAIARQSFGPILSHHAELARASSNQPNGGRRIDRGDDDKNRFCRSLRTRRKHLRQRRQGQRRRNAHPQHRRRRVPSKMELHHRPAFEPSRNMKQLFRGSA
jgi:hypothetical protein